MKLNGVMIKNGVKKLLSPGAQVKQDLADKVAVLEKKADNGPVTLAFLANTRRLSTKWDAYLFNWVL
ncbi:MAG: hypothetical protein GY934_12310 [Gammaproteobacteria bacterium]|nr:hypothetical protein [Gammaproteobacteria bacterium]